MRPDLNLLVTLDVLLQEGSVARAAKRLRLSPSAMSRALARLRSTTGDPLLVRAGRGLVPSPRAIELRTIVHDLVLGAEGALRPVSALDPARLQRTFTIRTREGFVENFGPALLASIASEAPGVRLHFSARSDRESSPLRDGTADLETGVVAKATGPELMSQALFVDRFVGVARRGHPLSREKITLRSVARSVQVAVRRFPGEKHPVDQAFAERGLERRVAVTIESFAAAVALAKSTDLVTIVPERHTESFRQDTFTFSLPVPVPRFTVSMLWHPRLEGDAAHRWLRGKVRLACASGV